ncbi:MAG: M48 family metalloprotease [Fibrella sp.]|nr:M48 family metalloprotease [Armatimonadota bacterium]
MPDTETVPPSATPWDARDRIRLANLSSAAFVSDTDRAALENIQRIPLLPQILRKFHEMALDKISYAQNSAESVRCGPKQYPTLHRMLRESCEILQITEPELYIHQSEVFNAYTSGANQTFIVLHSSLVAHFTDEELLFVIGHECGHIKAGHVLYQEIGRMLMPLLEIIGQATLGLGQLAGLGLVAAFYEWMRQAEMSCDRAGLLVVQDPRSALSALMKLGGGSTRFDNEANLDTFLEQARAHSQTSGLEGLSRAILFVMYNWQLSHPQVVFRAKGLDEWEQSGAYQRILDGNYPRDMMASSQLGQQVKCSRCRKMVTASLSFCPECGQDLHPERAAGGASVDCGRCGAKLAPGTKFCPNCGSSTEREAYPPSGMPQEPPGNYPPPQGTGVVQTASSVAQDAFQGVSQGVSSLWNAAKGAIQPGQTQQTPVQPYQAPPSGEPYQPPRFEQAPPMRQTPSEAPYSPAPDSPQAGPPPVIQPPPVIEHREEQ